MALTDKNLYAYCDNNPVVRVDYDGQFWDYVIDIDFLAWSVADVVNQWLIMEAGYSENSDKVIL